MKITIQSVERPDSTEPETLIRWLCEVFGLLGVDEESAIEEQILTELINAAYHNKGISSSDIRVKPSIARSTVIYHLNRLISTGLIVKRGRQYYLRATDISRSIEEIEYDLNRELMKILDAARAFDNTMLSKRLGKGRRVKIE